MGKINERPPERRRVGLIFDERMCGHKNPGKSYHPENPERIRAVWKKLNDSGVAKRCVVVDAKEAEDDHLASVHSEAHIDLIKTISSKKYKTMRKSAKKFDSIYFNEGSSKAAYLAAGSVIEAAEKVAKGELDSAFAIVRPPGHHAEEAEPMGFCLYNNVAIAASFLLNERPELGMKKILIVDWDVHHGNSTQKMFYQDSKVLFFSIHRHESGNFYPYSNDGSYNMIGEGTGAGYNINVPWENGMCGDADYFAVWDHILIPIAKEFDPDMIIISAGFDAVIDDPIGGCCVSPNGYSVMLDKLMGFARGKIVLALEGGYNPSQLANSAQACIEVLLEQKPLSRSSEDRPLESTWLVIQAVRQALCIYWPVLAEKLPDKVITGAPSQIGVGIGFEHGMEEADGHSTSLQGRKDDLEYAQACENAYHEHDSTEVSPILALRKRAREGPSDTSHCRKVRTGLFSYGLSPLEDVESVWDTNETSLSGDNISKDNIKRSILRSSEEFEAELNQSLTKMEMLFSPFFVAGVHHQGHSLRSEGAEKKSHDEVAYLRKKNNQLKTDRDRAEKALDNEITTGERFLNSESGKKWLKKAKNNAVNEFKKSKAFHEEILDAVSHIHDETMKAFRLRFREQTLRR